MRATAGATILTVRSELEVLWAGDVTDTVDALVGLGVHVVRIAADRCAQEAAARAPDMVVLAGVGSTSAAAIVGELRAQSPGATLPVVLICDGPSMNEPHRRAGLVASLSSMLPPLELASAIHHRLRSVASGAEQFVPLSWRELDAFIASAAAQGSCGLVITSDPVAVVAVGPNGRVAPSAETLRQLLRRPKTDEPNPMKFRELPAHRLVVMSEASEQPARGADVSGAHVAVIDPDAARRQELSAALIEAGAEAHAVSLDPDELARVSGLAPTLLVIASSALADPTVAELLEDPRIASTSFLVLDEARCASLAAKQVLAPAASLSEVEKSLQRRLTGGEVVVGRIESFGPAGWLKKVARNVQPLTLVMQSARGRAELSLSGSKIREARFLPLEGADEPLRGRAALDAALAIPFGRVLVGPTESVGVFEERLRQPHPISVYRPKAPGRRRAKKGDGLDGLKATAAARRVANPRSAGTGAASESVRPPPASVPSPRTTTEPRASSLPRLSELVQTADQVRRASQMPAAHTPPALTSAPEPPAQTPPAQTPPAQTPPGQTPPGQTPAPEPPALTSAPEPTTEPERPVRPSSVMSEPSEGLGRGPRSTRRVRLGVGLLALAAVGGTLLWLAWDPDEPVLSAAPNERPSVETSGAGIRGALAESPATRAASTGEPPATTPDPAPTASAASGAARPVAAAEAPRSAQVRRRSGAEVADLLQQAEDSRRVRQYAQAEVIMRRALELSPDDAAVNYQMALTMLRLRRRSEARTFAQRAMDLDPQSPLPWLLEGDVLLQLGQMREARGVWTRCLEVRPTFEPCQQRLDRWAGR